MIYIKIAVLISLIVVGILFGVSNQQNSSLHFFGYATKDFPLYLILFGAFITGAVLSFIYNILSGPELRDRLKKASEQVNELEMQLKEKQKQKEVLMTNQEKEKVNANAKASLLAKKQ